MTPRRALLLLALAELLGMSLWFSASAVAPALRERWSLTVGQAGWLTSIVQLGFVVGTATAAVLNLADVLPSRLYFALSALLASLANAALLLVPSFESALLTRFLVGFFLAGVYPPAMKMVATWFLEQRGLAIGTIVGALTLGKAAPYLVGGARGTAVDLVVLLVSGGAVLAALLVGSAYRDGLYAFERRAFSWRRVRDVLADRGVRLAIGGYLGHMWELYAMWTWLAAFLAASAAVRGDGGAVGAQAFAAIGVAGAAGCVWGGWMADRIGREWLAAGAMAASGACALVIGLGFGGPPLLVLVLALAWGFFVIADSAQFSALVTEVAPRDAVGTALTLQTSLGFLLTMASIQLVPAAVSSIGWRWAFGLLVFGPLAGIPMMVRLARVRVMRDR